MINLTQFEATIWAKNKGQNIKNIKKKKKMADYVVKSKSKCIQCGYASSNAGHLSQHLKAHSGEKSNKCNQCGFASSRADNLQ